MKCENCMTEIKAEFTFALKNNQCPACGEKIMPQATVGAYISLTELLKTIPDIDVDKIAGLIISNFEVKQLFRTEAVEVPETKKKTKNTPTQSVVVEEAGEDEEESAEVTASRSLKQIKAMKEQAYQEALAGSWGMDVDITGEDANLDLELLEESKKQKSLSKVLSGSGSFSRKT